MMLTLISGAFVPQAVTVQQYWTLVAVNQTRVAGEKVDGGPLPTPVTTPRSLVWPNTMATTFLYLIIRYIFFIMIIFSFQCTLRSLYIFAFLSSLLFQTFLFPFSFVEKGEVLQTQRWPTSSCRNTQT